MEEFDRRFNDGEDIHDLIDMSKAKIVRYRKKVHITLDVAEELVKEIDGIREQHSHGPRGFDQKLAIRKSKTRKGADYESLNTLMAFLNYPQIVTVKL